MNEHLHWVAAELHTHTRHSDGVFTTEELLRAAKAWGVQVVAITDHNTRAPPAGGHRSPAGANAACGAGH